MYSPSQPIEIFSEEPGIGFSEHFLIDNGKLLKKECVDYSEELDEDRDEYVSLGGFKKDCNEQYLFSI